MYRKSGSLVTMTSAVRPTSEVRVELSQIARRFDAGDAEPVIFGSHRRPQAVIIPVALWEQLASNAGNEAHESKQDSNSALRYATTRPYGAPPTDFTALRGKRSGQVHLPKHLDWSPGRAYRLDDTRQRRALYEVLLQEGSTQEFETYLNAELLASDWAHLRLPPKVRAAWEDQFPFLTESV